MVDLLTSSTRIARNRSPIGPSTRAWRTRKLSENTELYGCCAILLLGNRQLVFQITAIVIGLKNDTKDGRSNDHAAGQ
jgi:hypothetical protein